MSLRHLLYVVGSVVAAVGVAMLSAAVVALIYQEWGDAWQIAMAAVVTVALGQIARKVFDRPGELSTREGFAAVGLSWLAITFFGTLPYLYTGAIGNFTNALFETAAGFSTTGASVVPDPAVLSHSILFWRSLTQWLGGMGIIVLGIAILPLLGVGGVQLARAESPGPTPDRLTPRFRETAKRLWYVYLGLTAAEVLFLVFGDMSLFESVAHALTTMSTGGFSTNAGSLGAFSAYSQWVVIVFMFLAGVSFALHFRAMRKPKEYGRNPEFRLYLFIMIAAGFVAAVGTWGGAVAATIRDALFTAVSITTTTGYGTADFGVWAPALQIMIVGLMFVGAMAGSTGGSVKVFRIEILAKASLSDLRRLIHPRGIFVTRVGKQTIKEEIVESVQSFFLLYMFLFITGTLLFAIFTSVAGTDLSLATSASAVASAIGNIGPGLEAVGPTSNYLAIPALGKWLLSLLMIVGRLEIFPIILLFSRELWRK